MQLIELIDKQMNVEEKLRFAVLIIDSALRSLETKKEVTNELRNNPKE